MQFFKSKRKYKNISVFIATSTLLLGVSNPSYSASYAYTGKCGFLLSNSFTEKCTALFNKGILTFMPKGSPQERIFPTQIASYSLSSEESVKVNENLEKWERLFPERTQGFLFWRKKTGIPKWVLEATSKKVSQHKFIIDYVDKSLSPRKALFVLDDEGKAAGMQLALRKITGLYVGQKRTPGQALSPLISRKITREAERKSDRLISLCAASMYEDSQPISSELDAYVNNTIDEISIFKGYEPIAEKLDSSLNKAIAYCENKKEEDIAKAQEEERAAKSAKIQQDKEKREAAFDMLSSY